MHENDINRLELPTARSRLFLGKNRGVESSGNAQHFILLKTSMRFVLCPEQPAVLNFPVDADR